LRRSSGCLSVPEIHTTQIKNKEVISFGQNSDWFQASQTKISYLLMRSCRSWVVDSYRMCFFVDGATCRPLFRNPKMILVSFKKSWRKF
jgi:hypothetical protein